MTNCAPYRERCKGADCGDWLAKQIASLCTISGTDSKGRRRRMLDVDAFVHILELHGVPLTGKGAEVSKDRPGWAVRFRGNGR